MTHVVYRGSISPHRLDVSKMELTVKLVPDGRVNPSMTDVFSFLNGNGIPAEGALALYKARDNDSSCYLMLKNEEAVTNLVDRHSLSSQKLKMDILSFSQQHVTVKVHCCWYTILAVFFKPLHVNMVKSLRSNF